jgi:antirestriction protein ArdC
MDKKICQMVTDRIVAEMEKGIIPWKRPWAGVNDGAISHSTGKSYSLLNQIVLGKPGEYLTYKQCAAEGGHVKAGEHGAPVVFWKQIFVPSKDVKNKDGSPKMDKIPVLKYFTVFHIDQCEGIKPKYETVPATHPDPIKEAEDIVEKYESREKIKIIRDDLSNKAFYVPSQDYIQVPNIKQYTDSAEYYSTLFHEMVHSTGHSVRLNRFTGKAARAAFGSEEYSKEELVAEIGAATLNSHVGIETDACIKNSAAYVQSWVKVLRNDPTMIISAAGKADKAVEYILN